MAETLTYTGTLEVHTCWCGIAFAMPADLARWHRQGEGNKTYCPLGHAGVIRKTDADRKQELLERREQQLAATTAQLDQARADAEHQRNRVKGYQGALGKAKKRAARGVCPAPGCKRSFVDVARHVTTCHPDFAAVVATDG